mmetsp:Transcript_44891/g.72921  ORF Transcript_44891/g.72921 Transcript_44891/m.72921 type:complete len:479 (-) Transcript_44891:268-1704(-)
MKSSGSTLPGGLKVKNTFIDVRPNFVDQDGTDMDNVFDAQRKRQTSEPAMMMGRQLSGVQPRMFTSDSTGPMTLLAPAEEEEFDLDEAEEPDEEIEPHRVQRQDTEGFETGLLGRQVTEQHWPSWGQRAPATGFPATVSSSSDAAVYNPTCDPGNLWLFGYGAPSNAECAALEGVSEAFRAPSSSQARGSAQAQAALGAVGSRTLAVAAQQAAQRQVPPGGDMAVMGATEPTAEWATTVTVMMRNLPNKYNQQMLLEELNSSGFLGTYDFVYLPIDPETNANRGYSFINFIDPSFAWMLKLSYEGRKMGRFNSDKVVSVAPAALQGFEANHAHYSTARVNRGDPSTRPLFLRESCMSHSKPDGGRRRGGRRSQGSLIDLAARQQSRQTPDDMSAAAVSYINLQGPAPPGAVEGTSKKGADASGKAKSKPPASASSSAAQVNLRPKFCPYCGGEAQPQFRFCQFCGAALNFGGPGDFQQ